mgnify:FL=1
MLRLLPDLETAGGMARVLVAIDAPFAYEREGANASTMPLLLGSYVTVDIDVPALGDVVEVPRLAVREGDELYVMNAQNELEVRHVRVVWGRPDTVLVDQGVTHGERVIVSRVPSPVDGLRLRQSGQPSAPQADASGATDE